LGLLAVTILQIFRKYDIAVFTRMSIQGRADTLFRHLHESEMQSRSISRPYYKTKN